MVFFNYIGIERYFRKAIEIILIIALLCSSIAVASTIENEYIYQNNTNENLSDGIIYVPDPGFDNDNTGKISSSLVDKIRRSPADEQVPVIILLKSNGNQNALVKGSSDVLSTLESNNGKVGHQYKLINAFSASIPAGKVSELARSYDVEKIWFDKILNLPALQVQNSSIKLNIGTNAIGANYIWNATGNTGKGITVAVIDTGVDYNHPDLGGCLGQGCRIKAGYDFVDNDADPFDEYGHGTHVTGIIGANGKVKGVAPDVEFLAAKVCGTMGCPLSAIIAGMDWAAANGADIISMSIGGDTVPNDEFSSPDSIIADSIVDKGIVVVVAAGNEGPGTGTTSVPGIARKVITVGASNDNGTKKVSDDHVAYFSNRGPSAFGRLDPDVVAPGVAIKSTWPNNTYMSIQGTSMATPFVSGSAALLLQNDPALGPVEVRSKLMSSANNLKKIEYQAREDYSGLWKGHNVELNVTDSVLKIFEISYHIYGGIGCPYYAKTTFYLNSSIIGGKFNYILSSSELNGTFSSINANGTFKNIFSSNYPYYSTCYSGLVKWKARPDSFVLSSENASVFEQGAGLVNIKKAILYSTKATINNNDRWETSVEPGNMASSKLKISNNNKVNSVNYTFSFEPLKDSKLNNEISLSSFSIPEYVEVAPGSNTTVKIVFSAPPDAKPSIYGTTLAISGNNSETIRIPVIITIPLIGDGTITSSTDEDATGGFGDWIYYKIKSHNGNSLSANLEWAPGYDDLDLFLFAPNGEIMDVSERRTGNSEEINLPDMAYDEYWLAVHSNKLESYEKKPYDLKVNYISGLEVLPSSWQGDVVINNTKDIFFTLRNDPNIKSNLNISVKNLKKGIANYSAGSMKGGLRTVWKASKNPKNSNISYLSALIKWEKYNKNIDMFVGYPGPVPSWIKFKIFPGINIGTNSIPTFGDLDKDKDPDMLIGKFDGRLSYYENTGSKSYPVWVENSALFAGVEVWLNSAPKLDDTDNDGDLDLTIGSMDGTLTYYENTGTSSSPVWTKDAMFTGIDAGYNSIPDFADLDSDGDLDLIIGNSDGILIYYENTGTSSSPAWSEDSSMFENIDEGTYSSPAFSDLDNDKDLDLVTGNGAGILKSYMNSPTKAWYSGKGNNLNNYLVGSFDLSSVSSATLNFRTWYEIESNFDTGYVQASTDGGNTWITLKKYSGSGGPVYDSVNLDTYAGNPDLLIRFNYSTDNDVILNGWNLDNISLPQIGFFDDAEGGANGWISNGWSIATAKWIYDPSMFSRMDAGSDSVPSFSDLDNDGDQDLVIGSYSGGLLYLMNSKWVITRFSSMHNNTVLGKGIENIENADIQYYMKKYGDVGILLYSEDPSSAKYNLTVNTVSLVPWKAATIDQTDIDLEENEEKQVKISINSSMLNADKTYDSIFIVQNSTEDFARVPIRIAVTKPDTIPIT